MSSKITKTFWIVIPVFVFFILMPNFTSQPKEHPGFVLGAFTDGSTAPETTATVVANPEIKKITDNPEPALQARAALVFDLSTEQVIYAKNSDQKLQIASLTKLMTALVAFADPNFSNPIIITKEDQLNVAPYLGLKVGDQVMPRDLLFAMLVGSANDAALTLGNHFPDQKTFLEKMNAKAAELGMISTKFNDPKGFDDTENYSTATDLFRLVDYALLNLPYEEIWKTNNYSFVSEFGNRYSVRNSNTLVFKDPNIKSIKTGLSPLALGNMIVRAEDQDGHQIVSIILNTTNRDQDTQLLTSYIFKNYSWPN